ncbi:signal peptidase II [Paenisporosarcina cavernae]|uniref:Lipoprotein signal peptidase n=1 Tax=Paenisporosarcina cavernae TaxID=2320858 RepID=A0A385YTD6_9BACL|nr:signal peptidase II [Paenisporosarcina cavernae]AYC29177.1 lipoprotein signal peptidase [Paenisporosarcina cavernae]
MKRYFLLAAVVIFLDQWTKYLVVQKMELGERIAIWDPTLALLSHRNKGAAWGMLQGQFAIFAVITVIVIAGILYFYFTEAKNKPMLQISLMVVLGGAIGNFIDRIVRGEVVDFVDVLVPIIHYDFPIFNVADAALTIGVILLIIGLWLEEKKTKVQQKVSDENA